jgi:hypothetical protein
MRKEFALISYWWFKLLNDELMTDQNGEAHGRDEKTGVPG